MPQFKSIEEIPLGSIEIGKAQVRTHDTGKEIGELADSIKKVGLLEPIVVAPTDTPGRYEVVTGQRRFLAHKELNKETILAAILKERVSEIDAKILSVTENLVRRNLNQIDLIDVCTELYYHYGTMVGVAKETGLPYQKITKYVKLAQLIPELKDLVKRGEVKLQSALRAQKAASVNGPTNIEEALQFAREMNNVSGAQQTRIVQDREANPEVAADEVIEWAKSGSKVTQIVVTLTASGHTSLRNYASDEGTSMDDAARSIIEESLAAKGFME